MAKLSHFHDIHTPVAPRRGTLGVRSSANTIPREQVACGNCVQQFITRLASNGPVRCLALRPILLRQGGRLE